MHFVIITQIHKLYTFVHALCSCNGEQKCHEISQDLLLFPILDYISLVYYHTHLKHYHLNLHRVQSALKLGNDKDKYLHSETRLKIQGIFKNLAQL